MITFALHTYVDKSDSIDFEPFKAAIEKRGFRCIIISSLKKNPQMPNQERADVMIEALKDIEGDIVLAGISNQGLYMPLVAAAHPIRRIVMINALVPTPGKSLKDAVDFKETFGSWIARRFARHAPALSEVCPLAELPQTEWVFISGEKDGSIRPEWQRKVARAYLHVDPTVIEGAGHTNIIHKYVDKVADVAIKELSASN